MPETTFGTDAPASPDVAALARQPAAAAPVQDWRLRWVVVSLWRLFALRPMALGIGLSAALLRAGLLLLVSAAVGRVVGGGSMLPWGVAAALSLLAAAALGCFGQHMVIDAIQDGLTRLRERLVDRQLSLQVDVVSNYGVEHFVLAMTRDGELLNQMARACFGALLPGLVLVSLCLGGIVVLLPTLALPLTAALAVLWLVRRVLSRQLIARAGLAHRAIDRLYEQLGGTVLRHETAVSQANEAHERGACQARIAEAHAVTRSLAGMQSWAAEVDTLVLGLALLGLLAWVAAAGGAAISGASLASVLFLLLALRGGLQGVLSALQELAQGVPALATIERLLALPVAPPHEGHVAPTQWQVALKGVSRRAVGRALVSDVNLTLEPGRVTVLTGENGAGKTTLLRLLLGLSEVDAGAVSVDGVPWAQIDRAAFRRGVGYLPQTPVLFAGTVRDNIVYAAPGATKADVLDAMRAVDLEARLQVWPDGLDTQLGASGNPLSGGERQRVALARVLLRRPRLLILDEPTNHMDRFSAEMLMSALRRMPKRPAVLVISHDPAIAALADEVLEMRDGRVRERQRT